MRGPQPEAATYTICSRFAICSWIYQGGEFRLTGLSSYFGLTGSGGAFPGRPELIPLNSPIREGPMEVWSAKPQLRCCSIT
jgi:hypothetical protein